MIKRFLFIVISASLINILRNIFITNTANQRNIFAQATEKRFCLSDFEYDKTHHLCVSQAEALTLICHSGQGKSELKLETPWAVWLSMLIS